MFALERWLAHKHDVQHNTGTPDIYVLVVTAVSVYFRCVELGCACHSHQLAAVRIELATYIEVDKKHFTILFGIENIIRLNISVNDLFRMQVF